MRIPDRVLFVGAHCDDIELLAGGLLARACRERRAVGVLVFSDHRGVVDDARAAAARAEMRANMEWLASATGATITDHSGELRPACRGAFESGRESIYAAMEALRSEYDLVITHPTADTNQDHRQVALEAMRVFKAHATLLCGEFPNNDLGDVRPSVYVPLAPADLDAKVRMVGGYASQRFDGRPYFDESLIRALARVRGSQIRREAAEAFSIGGRLIIQ